MDLEILKDLGLTDSEIKVYLALLSLGSSSAGGILEKSKLQNSVLHRALNSLIEKGLINFVFSGKNKIYQSTDPEVFLNFIDDKKERLKTLLPELKKVKNYGSTTETATVFKGIRGVKEIYSLMVSLKGDEYLTFGGGKPCLDKMGLNWWLSIHRKRIDNGLSARQVFDGTLEQFDSDFNSADLTSIKYLSKDFAQFQETVIVGDYVAIVVFSEQPYGFLIHDSDVASGYKKYFELLWSIAKIK